MRAGVERLIGRDDGEFLLGGDPPAGDRPAPLPLRRLVGRRGLPCRGRLRASGGARDGLGRALVSAAIERARERGCRRLELDTAEENVPALALYRSLGFRSGGDEPGRLGVFMRRRIDENIPPGWG